MSFRVLLLPAAEGDLEDIWHHVAHTDGRGRADRLLDALEERCQVLADMPNRGNVPKELRSLGITEYRELHQGPYRIIYRIMVERVVVYAVLDERRDMQSLLLRRLTR